MLLPRRLAPALVAVAAIAVAASLGLALRSKTAHEPESAEPPASRLAGAPVRSLPPAPLRGQPLPSLDELLGQAVARDGAKSLLMYRRVLAHLGGIDSHEARRLAIDVANQLEQLEHNLPEADLVRAVDLDRDTASQWRPLRDQDESGLRNRSPAG